ncbi:MAG: 30S ribosomal protein S5 [Candidatus ainarchaeum sp.]|nr:30S ribosomal protein S5 [Candidatus ainarchaeum sp.]
MENQSWVPKTKFGKKVKNQEITDVDEILSSGHPILEPETIDILLPDLKSETLAINTTQRVTDSGRKIKFRAIVVVGDGKGRVGLGSGKSEEVKPAIGYALKEAKKKLIKIKQGCGSWECKCKESHSIPKRTTGKEGSTIVTLYPAPKGVSLVANRVIKKVLKMAGVKDVWSKTMGSTSNVYNTASATINALNNLNRLKPKKGE